MTIKELRLELLKDLSYMEWILKNRPEDEAGKTFLRGQIIEARKILEKIK